MPPIFGEFMTDYVRGVLVMIVDGSEVPFFGHMKPWKSPTNIIGGVRRVDKKV